MAKFLLVIAVFIIFYLFLRNVARKSGETPPTESAESRDRPSRHGEDMVRCNVCGVHLPTSEAVTSRGEYFCSREHLRLAERERPGR